MEANEYDFPDGRPTGRCATCNAEGGCQHIPAPKYIPKEVQPHAGITVPAHRENQSDPTPAPYIPAQPRTHVSGGARANQIREIYGPAGPTGADGKPGVEGRPGRDGKDADITEVVTLAEAHMQTWLNATLKTAVSNAIKELGDLRGTAGKDGANSTVAGPAGAPGRDGSDGRSIIGPAGRDGKDGRNGRDADVEDVIRLAKDEMRTWLNSKLDAAVTSAIQALGNLRGERGLVGERGPAGVAGRPGNIDSAVAEAREAVAQDFVRFKKEMWDSRETLRSEIYESVRHTIYGVAKGEKP